jgi:outer membrane protein OmpA-like peptidoglycan-associated protein
MVTEGTGDASYTSAKPTIPTRQGEETDEMIRNRMAAAAIAALTFAVPAAAKLDPAYSYKLAGVRSDSVGQISGKVVEVDKVKRAIAIQGPDGLTRRFKAHSKVQNLEQVQVEDDVVLDYWRSARLYAQTPGAKANPPEIVAALEADKSGPMAAEAMAVAGSGTATVESVDAVAGVVTFRGPDGLAYPATVTDPLILAAVKAGDKYDFDVYEVAALGVTVKAKPLPPPPPPPPPPAPVTTAHARLTEKKIEIDDTIYFAVGKADIQPKSFAILDDVATIMNGNPQVKKIRVEGNASKDPKSSKMKNGAEFNLKLSDARAASVKKYLVEKGVDPSRLESIGYGWNKPVDTNATAAGRAKNRRVDFMVVDL